MTFPANPLFGPAPDSVPLSKSPLVAVLVQARFEQILSITKPEVVASFQEEIRARYPILTQESAVHVMVNGNQPEPQLLNTWRFSDPTGDWQVSLTTSYITLHTRAYKSRADFIDRFAEVLSALTKTIRPSTLSRLGVRYVDQIKGAEFAKLENLVSVGVRGFESAELRPHILQSMHDTLSQVAEGRIRARWGIMPKMGSHDTRVLPLVDTDSWVFDLDTSVEFAEVPQRFEQAMIVETARKLAARSYAVFRWAVTQEFLETYR